MEAGLLQNQWHYERSGKRLGPVDRATIGQLVDKNQIERTTLVWNPDMVDWAKAGSTDLIELFGNAPPPLPASEIRRWAIYILALVPLWGLELQATLSALISKHSGLSVGDVFDHVGWIGLYVVVNGIFGEIDEHQLRKGGLRLRGAAVLASILAPFYILASCLAIKRHSPRNAVAVFLPLIIWVGAFVGGIVAYPLFFDTNAPFVFRPDTWF